MYTSPLTFSFASLWVDVLLGRQPVRITPTFCRLQSRISLPLRLRICSLTPRISRPFRPRVDIRYLQLLSIHPCLLFSPATDRFAYKSLVVNISVSLIGAYFSVNIVALTQLSCIR